MHNDGVKNLLVEAFASAPRGTQARVAEALGLPAPTVNKWAKGYNIPEPARWAEVEQLLGLTEGSIAQAAGITQPRDGRTFDDLAALVQRLGDAVTRLEGRVRALERSGDRTPAQREPAGSRPSRTTSR